MPTDLEKSIAQLHAMISRKEAEIGAIRVILAQVQSPGLLLAEVPVSHVSPILRKTSEADILAIYEAYPRKVGRAYAIKAILKSLADIDPPILLERVKAYAAAIALWPEADREYIPHPATWFNRGSYHDDPATWVRKTSADTKGGAPLDPQFNKF